MSDSQVGAGLVAFLADLKGAITKLEGSLAGHAVAGSSAGATTAGTDTATTTEVTLPASVKDFDALIEDHVKPWVSSSSALGEPLAKQTAAVDRLFAAQRTLIMAASQSKKPGMTSPEFVAALQPLSTEIGAIGSIKDDNRRSPLFNHLSTVADGIPALGWVAIDKTPVPYVGEMRDSAQFYANRVIKEYREKDAKHADWAKAFVALLAELQKYVKQHHTTGLVFSPSAQQDLQTALASAAAGKSEPAPAPPAPAGGAPPPPPPPGPPPPPFMGDSDKSAPAAPGAGGDMNAVFAALNRGSDVTSGLKKVDKSQMTHKNPALRGSSVVSDAQKAAPPAAKPAPAAAAAPKAKKPPVKELDGTKWLVENYENDSAIVLDAVELNHSIQVFNCRNSTIQVKGKFNALSLNGCAKTSVLVDTLVSSIDLIKCTNFALQVEGTCPTIICDLCDGGAVYLSPAALGTEIMTAKCSSVNIYVPEGEGEQQEFKEQPIPEMLKHTVDPKTGKLLSTFVEYKD